MTATSIMTTSERSPDERLGRHRSESDRSDSRECRAARRRACLHKTSTANVSSSITRSVLRPVRCRSTTPASGSTTRAASSSTTPGCSSTTPVWFDNSGSGSTTLATCGSTTPAAVLRQRRWRDLRQLGLCSSTTPAACSSTTAVWGSPSTMQGTPAHQSPAAHCDIASFDQTTRHAGEPAHCHQPWPIYKSYLLDRTLPTQRHITV